MLLIRQLCRQLVCQTLRMQVQRKAPPTAAYASLNLLATFKKAEIAPEDCLRD
jgi:hypothetical protein